MSLMDTLGDRIKSYEARETMRKALPGLPLVVRIDGRSFSKFTAGMTRPFDANMAEAMLLTTEYLVDHMPGAKVGYTQSDEINIILDPAGLPGPHQVANAIERALDAAAEASDEPLSYPEAIGAVASIRDTLPEAPIDFMFDGRYSKLTSVFAGMASARFLLEAIRHWPERVAKQLPVFDCRVFQVPSREEAVNTLLWRELDAVKNSISMAARAHFSHKRLHGLSGAQMQELLFQEAGINFNNYPPRFKRGAYVQRRTVERALSPAELARIPAQHRPTAPVKRSEIVRLDLPPLLKITNRVEVLLDGADPIPVE